MTQRDYTVTYMNVRTKEERTMHFKKRRLAEDFIRSLKNSSRFRWTEANFEPTWRSDHHYMFNVDRWTIYSRQKFIARGFYSKIWKSGKMSDMTPAQIRRCKKKMRKNNDTSIGVC